MTKDEFIMRLRHELRKQAANPGIVKMMDLEINRISRMTQPEFDEYVIATTGMENTKPKEVKVPVQRDIVENFRILKH